MGHHETRHNWVVVGLGALLALLVALGPAAAADTEPKPPTPRWRSLGPGLDWGELEAKETVRAGSDRLVILRIDPLAYRFQILADSHGDGWRAGQWRSRTGALAVFNAGQYMADGSYLGLLVADGKAKGRLVSQLEGLFLAEPADPGLPLARVLDRRYAAFDPANSPYRQVAQSLMLLDRFGQVRVRRSPRIAHRTVVAEDQSGRILILVTEGAHTLWELATLIKESGLSLREVMCMDGGQESQLSVGVGEFTYEQYGGPSASPELPLPWPAPPLPAAIAVFHRNPAPESAPKPE